MCNPPPGTHPSLDGNARAASTPRSPAGPARTHEVGDGGQLPEVLQELVQGVLGIRGDPILVLQQELPGGGGRRRGSEPGAPGDPKAPPLTQRPGLRPAPCVC